MNIYHEGPLPLSLASSSGMPNMVKTSSYKINCNILSLVSLVDFTYKIQPLLIKRFYNEKGYSGSAPQAMNHALTCIKVGQ
jgi:hypothetical protein